jgi:tRNA(adenine34) deaminase
MSEICKIHDEYMAIALDVARKSSNDVPIGAIIVKDNKIIARACNRKELENDPTAHAEILAIREAANIVGNWRLDNTSIYITLEPCPMCAAAILYSRIPHVFFGAYDPLYGAFGSATDMQNLIKFNPSVIGGIKEEECSILLKNFFNEERIKHAH